MSGTAPLDDLARGQMGLIHPWQFRKMPERLGSPRLNSENNFRVALFFVQENLIFARNWSKSQIILRL